MLSIQLSHTVPSRSYRQSPMRTEYEYIMPFKASSDWCMMAKQDGVVKSLDDYQLVIEYKDGTVKHFQIGEQYGAQEGVYFNHSLKTTVKAGQKFKKNDPLYYHEDFFEPDYLDPSKIVFKVNRISTIALNVNAATHEDSCSISAETASEMTTEVVKVRKFTLDFGVDIQRLVKVGDAVEPNDALFIDMGSDSNAGNLTQGTITMLESISSLSPRAEYKGIVDRIEVKYNGDLSDMNPNTAKLVSKLDKITAARTKGTDYEAKDNKVTAEYTADGTKLDLDNFELKIFIKVKSSLIVGDKVVLANQAKSVIGEVYDYTLKGEKSGDKVDYTFNNLGFIYRAIVSPYIMGVNNRVVRLAGLQIAKEHFSK